MPVFRSSENPIIVPKDVKPSRPDFEVVCVFNAGVTRYKGKVVLLLRVAERPIQKSDQTYVVPIDVDCGVTRFVVLGESSSSNGGSSKFLG